VYRTLTFVEVQDKGTAFDLQRAHGQVQLFGPITFCFGHPLGADRNPELEIALDADTQGRL